MKKILSLIFVPAVALLSSCGQSNEQEANKLFVESAIKANSALEKSNNYKIEEAVALLEEAVANCDKILAEFPETNIAVSLVSGKELNLGSLKYADLPATLSSMKKRLKAAQDFGIAGELLYNSPYDAIKEAHQVLYAWREPIYKTAPNAAFFEFYPAESKDEPILKSPQAPQAQSKKSQVAQDITMEEVLPLSRQIKLDVDLISYEKAHLESLLALTDNISAKPNLLQLVSSYMPKMKENVAKITLLDQREAAYLLLSKIFANMDKSEAASIAFFNIKNEELQTQALVYYVDKLIEKESYNNAIELLANIRSQAVKDDMALDMSKLLRENNKIDLALKVLDSCTDKERRSNALVEICAQVISEGNIADISKFLENNIGTLSEAQVEILSKRLTLLDEEDKSARSKEYLKALALSELVALFAPHNNAYATKLSQQVLDVLPEVADRKEKEQLLKKHLDTAMLFANMDASKFVLSKAAQSLLSPQELQDIYLKYMVYHSLNNEEELAKIYLDLIDTNIASREKIIIAFLKANKSKEEILEVINN